MKKNYIAPTSGQMAFMTEGMLAGSQEPQVKIIDETSTGSQWTQKKGNYWSGEDDVEE